MTVRKRIGFLIPLLVLTLSCQALARTWQSEPLALLPFTASPSPTRSPQATSTPSQTPSPTRTATPTSTATFTPSPTLTPTPTVLVTPSALQLSIFEDLWQIISDEYLYPDFNGLDWEAIRTEYRQRIEAGLTDPDFYLAMDEMIFRLGDEHSVFLSPQEVLKEEAEYAGDNNYVGVGILITAVPERDRAAILLTFPGSPAEAAGLQSHDSILAVDGEPILDENGFLKDIVRGPLGTQIELTVQSPGGTPRSVTLVRERITGSIPTPHEVLTTPSGKRVGYLLLVTFNDSTIDDQIQEALETMTEAGPLDGLIVDNRQNSGGADTILRGTLAYFTGGTLGYFISRDAQRPLIVKGLDVNGSQSVPLVLLVGSGTASYGEIFVGVLKDQGRAYLIGETTEGNVETLWGYDFEDGSRAWLAHESFRPLNNPEENWEESGIIPHLQVVAGWDEFVLEQDPAVQAALHYLDEQVRLPLASGYGKLPDGSGKIRVGSRAKVENGW